MKFSENWLRTWVSPELDSAAFSHLLTMAGLEVEELEAVAPEFTEVYVAEVKEVVKHPDADRLNICQVDVGGESYLTIVCGAPNVRVGVKVPCATVGANLPGDFKIKKAKVRGVESFGMLCSAKELGLEADAEGLLILPEAAPVGQLLRTYLDLDDSLITLKLTPNRSDCSGMLGIAREVSALTGVPWKAPSRYEIGSVNVQETLPVAIHDTAACPLYCGRVIKGIDAAASTPAWMAQRLERSGLRTISAVVDITNYVMLELGQPMHAFDLACINGGIQVRMAASGERLALLNDQEVELEHDVLVVADEQRPLAMAGIMGGKDSGVSSTTQDIFLESAFFAPDALAGRARRHGLATDSSFRFERGVDFGMTISALERATELVMAVCGGNAGAVSFKQGNLPQRPVISLRSERVSKVLGIDMDRARIQTLLARLSFDFSPSALGFDVTPPSYRFDIAIEEDLIEELARLHGYDTIPALLPNTEMGMLPVCETQQSPDAFRDQLVQRDYHEIISFSFLEEKVERDLCGNETPVRVLNPIASNLSVMRSSLIGGLLEALTFNIKRKQERVRLFEIGDCFHKDGEGYRQTSRLSGIAYGSVIPEQWGQPARKVDFFDVKSDVESLLSGLPRFERASHPALHPGRSARILLDDKEIGWLGELHPAWAQQYGVNGGAVWFELSLDAIQPNVLPSVRPVAKALHVRRDIAVTVDDAAEVQAVLDIVHTAAVPYVREVALFDVYRGAGMGDGKKGLAFRVLLQDTEKTLSESEIDHSIDSIVSVLQSAGISLRV